MAIDTFQNFIIRLVSKISQYSLVYHLIVLIFLFVLQLNIFKETVPTDHIINAIMGLVIFTISANIIEKILKRNRPAPRPFLYCPECVNAKMKVEGKWICEKCAKVFSAPKKKKYLD